MIQKKNFLTLAYIKRWRIRFWNLVGFHLNLVEKGLPAELHHVLSKTSLIIQNLDYSRFLWRGVVDSEIKVSNDHYDLLDLFTCYQDK